MKNRKNKQKVAIVMGSQSDYSTMQFCEKVLKVLKIKFEPKLYLLIEHPIECINLQAWQKKMEFL